MKDKINDKKAIVALALLFGASFGFMMTFAVNRDSASFNNNFGLAEWKTVFTEEFESPSNWTTCETVDKTITVKNESNIDAAVRIKIDEQWLKNDGTELPLMSAASGNQMAIINFTENSGWEKATDGYYYYDVDLRKNDETTSLTTGVTLNCDANLSIDADYAAATYHLKFTAQTIQYDQKSAWRTTLYDVVANQSRGIDSGIDFRVTPNNGNNIFNEYGVQWTYMNPGAGVFTTYETSSYTFPVHYYRGETHNNHVIFADKCWHIVRTTTTGGVKLIYDGEIVMSGDSKTCSDQGIGIEYGGKTTHPFAPDGYRYSYVGYTYGQVSESSLPSISLNSTSADTVYFGNDIEYNDGVYTLKNVVSGTMAEVKESVIQDHHYYCANKSEYTCEDVYYVFEVDRFGSGRSLSVKGYNSAQEKYRAVMIGDIDSSAKTTIDGWYEQNLLSFTDKLEDTVFCNDRSMTHTALNSKDDSALGLYDKEGKTDAYVRTYEGKNGFKTRPTLDCARKDDSYTVNETGSGNGKLDYPVGLMTADEANYAGAGFYDRDWRNGGSYLNTGENDSWTMTPSFNYAGCLSRMRGWTGQLSSAWGGDKYYLQPVISLKPGTYYKSGDGTASNPIIVE